MNYIFKIIPRANITRILLIVCFLGSMLPINIYSHEGHHKKTDVKDSVVQKESTIQTSDSLVHPEEIELHEKHTVTEFPNYHPLVVHFPIVLLIAATLFQLLSFVVYKKELSLVVFLLLLFGVIGALVASYLFHGHPHHELPNKISELFEEHEKMASYTLWLSIIALLGKIISHFFLERKFWLELMVTLFTLSSAITVSIAGHHGASLVHIEGVGPKGNYLESNHHH